MTFTVTTKQFIYF